MKIGIITHWKDLDNYGAALQSYALQRYLRDFGHEAFVIRYYQKNQKHNLLFKLSYVILHPCILFNRKKNQEKQKLITEWNKKRNFDSFRANNVQLSERVYYGVEDLQRDFPPADVYITGSDQVWGGSLNNEQNKPFFLDFGRENTVRIAYAASFGRGYFPCENEVLFKRLLSRFNAISMREESGVEILKERGINSIRCLDSTLLLPVERYKALSAKRKHREKYAFYYTVNVADPKEIYWEQLRDLLKFRGINSIVTTGSGYLQPEELFEGAEYDYSTVEEWLANIEHSELVITASFHGIVFSYLYCKNFIYMPLKAKSSKGNNRVTDMLSSVGLLNRMANSWEDVKRLVDEPIDYCNMSDRALASLLNQSKEFIKKAIDC